MQKKLLVIKMIGLVIALLIGNELNKLALYVKNNYFDMYVPIPNSDKQLANIEYNLLNRGYEKDYFNLKKYYIKATPMTQDEILLDCIIACNKNKTLYTSTNVYVILKYLADTEDLQSEESQKAYSLFSEMANTYLLCGALNGDYEARLKIYDIMYNNADFYNEKMDSLARVDDWFTMQHLLDSVSINTDKK